MKKIDLAVMGYCPLGLKSAIKAAKCNKNVLVLYTKKSLMTNDSEQIVATSGHYYYPHNDNMASYMDQDQFRLARSLNIDPKKIKRGVIKVGSLAELEERKKWAIKHKIKNFTVLDADTAKVILGRFYETDGIYILTRDYCFSASLFLDNLERIAERYGVQFKEVDQLPKFQVIENGNIIIDLEDGYVANSVVVCAGTETIDFMNSIPMEYNEPSEMLNVYELLTAIIPDEESLKVDFYFDSTTGLSVLRDKKEDSIEVACLIISDNKERIIEDYLHNYDAPVTIEDKYSLLRLLPRHLSQLNDLEQTFKYRYALGLCSTHFSTHRPYLYRPAESPNIIFGRSGKINQVLPMANGIVQSLLGLCEQAYLPEKDSDVAKDSRWYQKYNRK